MTEQRPVRPLAERKQRWAEKQAQQGKGLFQEAPGGSGPPNRHGMPKLPPGQRQVPNWPVLDLGDAPEIALDAWRLEVDGLVGTPLTLTWRDLMAMPQVEDTSDFHCVTTWSRMDLHWRGVRFVDIIERADPLDAAAFVTTTGYDHDPSSGEPYTTNLSLAEATKDDVLLVHTVNEQPLPREHGGPCRMITPQLYAWKGAKWIRRITLTEADQPGFWERRGYSHTAIPWYDDRYHR